LDPDLAQLARHGDDLPQLGVEVILEDGWPRPGQVEVRVSRRPTRESGAAQQEVDLETDIVGDAQDHGDPGDAESEVLEAEGRPRANPDLRPVEARRRVPGDPARRVPDG